MNYAYWMEWFRQEQIRIEKRIKETRKRTRSRSLYERIYDEQVDIANEMLTCAHCFIKETTETSTLSLEQIELYEKYISARAKMKKFKESNLTTTE